MIDHALQHNNSLHNSSRQMDDLIGSGQGILDNLREQRSTLKSAHKKVLDLMNTLGLTNTVMRLIERRTYQDKFILYGGMILTCIIMFITVKYFLYWGLTTYGLTVRHISYTGDEFILRIINLLLLQKIHFVIYIM